MKSRLAVLAALACACLQAAPADPWCSPAALAASRDGRTLYVACATAKRVDVFDTGARKVVRRIPAPAPPAGLALSPDGRRLYVSCAAPASRVLLIDTKTGKAAGSIPAGHTAGAAVLSPDGALLYVCNRFDNDVSILDTAARKPLARVKAVREPLDAALTPDGKLLLVANAMPAGRADTGFIAAEISLIDTERRAPAGSIRLPNGSTGVRAIRISPDGRLACTTHLLSRYYLPTTQVERGWMQTNAFSLIDVPGKKLLATVLLDEIDRGAANPWAVAWSAGGTRLAITHAGTRELSLIDVPALLNKLAKQSAAGDLAFLVGLRKRIPLAAKGPRALALAGNRTWVAGYFSDTLEEIDLERPGAAPSPVTPLSQAPWSQVRKGEALFNDGSLCFQAWQSCASCHGFDARTDGLNWDLLNDGIGNPKNVKSLLLSHRTPPAMSEGVRETAEAGVRAGLRHILFAEPLEADAAAIDTYLKSLKPVPSPFLKNGKPTAAAARGRKLFQDARVGCAACHPPGLFTNLRAYDVGTRSKAGASAEFDTPTLVEIWRTAPYLHDGSAATLRDVLTTANRNGRHGRTSHLSPREIDDLVAWLLSL